MVSPQRVAPALMDLLACPLTKVLSIIDFCGMDATQCRFLALRAKDGAHTKHTVLSK